MEVKGTIKFIGQTEQVTDSFSKRDLVVTTDEQYPQHISIQFTQAKTADLDGFQVGQKVVVSINLRGKEYQDKQTGEPRYFNSINGWQIKGEQMQAPQGQPNFNQNNGFNQNQGYQQPQQGYQQQGQPQFNQGFNNNNNGNGGLPF